MELSKLEKRVDNINKRVDNIEMIVFGLLHTVELTADDAEVAACVRNMKVEFYEAVRSLNPSIFNRFQPLDS